MPSFGAVPGKTQPISVSHPAAKIEDLIASPCPEDLVIAAGHGSLNEDLAMAMLRRPDLPIAALEAITKNQSVLKDRKVLLHVIQHQRTPRHLSLPMLRRLFVFELMDIAMAPAVAADIKLFAEELLIGKLGTLSLGESISLARRASTGVAGALLLRPERAVIEAALQNARTTEASIMKALAKPEVSVQLLSMLMKHPKWSLRREIQVAILRRPETPEELVVEIAGKLPKSAIRDLVRNAKLPQGREALLRTLESQTL